MLRFLLFTLAGLLSLPLLAQEQPLAIPSGPTAEGWQPREVKKTDAYASMAFAQADYKATAIYFRTTDAGTLQTKFFQQLKTRETAQQCLYYGINSKLLGWPVIRYVMQDKQGCYQASLFVIAPAGEGKCMTILIETPVPTLRVIHDWAAMEQLLLSSFDRFAEKLEMLN